jgi:hypothetical protein
MLNKKKRSEREKKQHSAIRKEGRNRRNGGAKHGESVRRKAVKSTESAWLSGSRRMSGGAFWACHPRRTLTKYDLPIIAR